MTEAKVNLEAFPSFSELQSLLSNRFSMDPDEAAKRQPEFELALRERMRHLECDFHKADFERMDVEAGGVVADGKRFRFKKKHKGTTRR
jgi:hypothetical protein